MLPENFIDINSPKAFALETTLDIDIVSSTETVLEKGFWAIFFVRGSPVFRNVTKTSKMTSKFFY